MIIENTLRVPSFDPQAAIVRSLKTFEEQLTNVVVRFGEISRSDRDPNKLYIFIEFESTRNFRQINEKDGLGDAEKIYDYIFTIDPYTAEYRNKALGKEKYIVMFHPIPFIPKERSKSIDVIYCGGKNNLFNSIKNIDGLHTVCSAYNGPRSHKGISYEEKIDLISRSKISICHNIWWITEKNKERLRNNITSKHIESLKNYESGITTELKSRVFEAAICKSLILCLEDDYKLIERFFDRDQFIYFNYNNVKEKINEIVKNYDKYSRMINSAYLRTKNDYLVRNLFQKIEELWLQWSL